MRKTGFVTARKSLSAAAFGDEQPGLQMRTDALQLCHTGTKITRISPNSPPNAPYIGNLKGQIRCALPLSARSLPVFAVPNASPSVTSVYPLLYRLPPFASSLSLFSLLPSDGSTFYSRTKINIFCHQECDNYPVIWNNVCLEYSERRQEIVAVKTFSIYDI